MKRFFLLFFALSGVLTQINAQRLEKFSEDPAEFTVQLEEMMKVADAGKVMPPKSTWVEPRMKNGLIVQEY